MLTLIQEAVWNPVVSVATRGQTICYALRASALGSSVLWTSCGLLLWQTDLFGRWHPMTVPRWKLLSSSVRSFYWQWLSTEIAWLCAQFYTPVSNGSGWNSQIHLFEGVSTYFCIYGVLAIILLSRSVSAFPGNCLHQPVSRSNSNNGRSCGREAANHRRNSQIW